MKNQPELYQMYSFCCMQITRTVKPHKEKNHNKQMQNGIV